VPYTKLIQSGTLVEEWEFQREPSPDRLLKKKKPIRRLYPRERRPDAIIAARKRFQRLVRANLSERKPPALLTLTTRDIVGISEGYALYTRFCKDLRREYGLLTLRWVAVPEFQKRGAVHFHILMWGLPDDWPCILSKNLYTDKAGKKKRRHVCPKARSCERRTRRLANLWGTGYADLVLTDGNARISSYLAKYMSKALHDKRLIGKRGYSASRNIVRPVSLNTPFQISIAKEDWGIGGDTPVALYREYDTVWLGRCVYKQFIVDIAHEDSHHG